MSLWAAALVACGMFYFAWKSRREYLRFAELLPGNGSEPVTSKPVTAIIPARNEAANITRCVESIRPQVSEVIVVDDGSTDDTGKLAAAAGARVISAPTLQPGHKGKPNACLAGARSAGTPWLLFVDADTWYEPGFVCNLTGHAEAERLTMVSVFLQNHVHSFWERVLVPYAFGLYFAGVSVEGVHSLKSREVLANGQCLLFAADAYEFTGGHRSVIKSIIEDVELARLGKRHRLRFEVLRAESLGHVRMYDSLAAIRRGFQKNSFQFLDANPGVGVQVISASILATSWAPVLGWLLLEEQQIAALAFAAVPMLASMFWYRGILPAIFAPLAIYLFQTIAMHSMMAHYFGFSTVWKGRKV